MRELTIRIKFNRHSLGSIKDKEHAGRFLLPRQAGKLVILPTWHAANLRFAAQVLNREPREVDAIHWDLQVDGVLRHDCWYRRYYSVEKNGKPGRQRYSLHEAWWPGQVIGINCVVPATLNDDDFLTMMNLAGRYRGLSPWKPGSYGFFEVVSLRPRRLAEPADENEYLGAGDVIQKREGSMK